MIWHLKTESIVLPFSTERISWHGFDPGKDGNWLAVVESPQGLRLLSPLGDVALPPDLSHATVRCLGDLALVVVSRVRRQGDINAWIIDPQDGRVLNAFSVGDGVQDVMVLRDFIVFSYFDQGVLSFKKPSQEGIAIFDREGTYLWGYAETIHGANMILDCYSMCPVGPNRLAFFAYPDFDWVELDVARQAQTVLPVPVRLRGSRAISLLPNTAIFYGPYPGDGETKEAQDALFALDKRMEQVSEVGALPGRGVRGLSNGRLLSIGKNSVDIATFNEQ